MELYYIYIAICMTCVEVWQVEVWGGRKNRMDESERSLSSTRSPKEAMMPLAPVQPLFAISLYIGLLYHHLRCRLRPVPFYLQHFRLSTWI